MHVKLFRRFGLVVCAPSSELNAVSVIELVKFYLADNCFIIDETLYKQLTETAMGSPLSGAIAKVTKQYIYTNNREFISMCPSLCTSVCPRGQAKSSSPRSLKI